MIFYSVPRRCKFFSECARHFETQPALCESKAYKMLSSVAPTAAAAAAVSDRGKQAPEQSSMGTKHPLAHLPITEVVDQLGIEPTPLAEKNRFAPFDDHVHFDEEPHVYTVDDMPYRDSCTSFLGSFFGKFDGDAIAEKIVGSWKWQHKPDYRYYQMTIEQIKANWQQANRLGTRMHLCIELFYNGLEIPTHPDFQTREYAHHFKQFHNDYVVGKLEPFRTEWIVFDRTYELIGSVDGIFRRIDADNPYTLVLYDWKRCIKIDAKAYQDETATGPFEGLPKANYWKYALQLNTYKFIIERNTPYRVEEMVLLRCHPDAETYERLVVPDLQHYVRRAVEVRWRQIMQHDLNALTAMIQRTYQRVQCNGEAPSGTTDSTTTATAVNEQTEEEEQKKQTGEKQQEEGKHDQDEDQDVQESPLDPPSLAVQVLRRFEAHLAALECGELPSPTGTLPPLPAAQQQHPPPSSSGEKRDGFTYVFDSKPCNPVKRQRTSTAPSAPTTDTDSRLSYVFD